MNFSQLDGKLINAESLDYDQQEAKKYVASLRIDKEHFCNGCLISESYVLTTGQCINVFRACKTCTIMNLTVRISKTIYQALETEYHKMFNLCVTMTNPDFNLGMILVSMFVTLRNVYHLKYVKNIYNLKSSKAVILYFLNE